MRKASRALGQQTRRGSGRQAEGRTSQEGVKTAVPHMNNDGEHQREQRHAQDQQQR